MFKRSSTKRTRNSFAFAQAPVELLEEKRLLTTIVSPGDEQPTDGLGGDRTPATFFLNQEVPNPGYSLKFEEIRIVENEVWVLSEFQQLPGVWPAVIGSAGDTVTVDIPNLPIKNFRIGGGDGFGPDTDVTAVRNRDEFYDLIGDSPTEVLYSKLDPELAEWREQVQTEIVEQADALYGEQFGAEAEAPIYYYRGLPVAFDFSLANTVDLAERVSDTNVQVDGVDEGDIVETDGTFIYTISGQEIVIVKAATADAKAEVVSRIELSENPQAMFLTGDRLTVISQEYGNVPWLMRGFWAQPSSSRTVVTVLDVSDRQAPALVQESIVDGQYQSSRAIGDQVYVVVTNNDGIPYVPELNTVYEKSENGDYNYRFETREEYLKRVDEFVNGGEHQNGLTPPSAYRRGDENIDQQGLERLGWLDGANNVSPDGGQLTSVLQFDTTSSDSTPVSNIGVNTRRYGATQIYSSSTALYLVTEEYTYGNSSGGGILDFAPQPSTVESRIHKIGLETGKLVLEGEGVVPGNVESQFSIDEHDGYLRIVTTTGRNWWWTDQSSQNHLFVLQDNGDTLDVVGSIRDLAAGERIYSARFDGDRAWMVTFRQVDPVFSFDLSDPTNPVVTGELKIPGYSDHLQLIDENHLLAIGRNATEEGRVQEVQVSLFDVSDMTQPALLHRYSMDSEVWGNSEALQDHLAFNYLPDSQILAVPFGPWGQQGMVLLHVDVTDGIELVGEVGSSDKDPNILESLRYWNQDNSYRRSVQIDDLLYAISTASISIVNLNDPGTLIQTVKLQEERAPWHTIPELPIDVGPVEDVLRLVERLGEDGTAEEIRLSLDGLLSDVLPDPEEIEEYEFRVLDRTTGDEILRQAAPTPEVVLTDDAGAPLDPGTYDVQFRTKTNRLRNPEFGAWSAPEALAVRSEAAEMISDRILRFGERVLKWARISDRILPPEIGTSGAVNPVEHYQVWINDAVTNQLVKLDRNVDRPELPLDLEAGGYFAWFRAVYADGTEGSWSLRERFEILGQKLRDIVLPAVTADTTPEFTLPELADAVSFEVEVTAPDDTVTTYDISNVSALRHEIADELSPGEYSFRARATLLSGVPTEWSDPVSFTIYGRPTVGTNGRQLIVPTDAAETVELWINRAGTSERVFHDLDFQGGTIADAIAELNLDPDEIAGYDVWSRLTMPDGSRTPWSPKAILNQQLADLVNVNPIASINLGEQQSITWADGLGIESFEVWVTKVGESGAFRRVADIVGTSYDFQEALPEGNFRVWVRGKLINGLHTAWGQAHSFAVENRPQLTIENQIASWGVAGEVDPNARYELWINQLDLSSLSTKVIHETDLQGTEFDLSSLGDGLYRGWVRKITQNGEQTVRSVWSRSVSFNIAALTDDLTDIFEDGLDNILSALDRI